jgi:predicted amidophosphoribosyltransferase
VPVPTRPSSLRARGYDQAAGLARPLAASLRLRCDTRALLRRRDDGPQAGRSRRRRRVQAAGAFRARAAHVWGERILLVDDVVSTGATADACARALLRAGAVDVSVLALAT